MKTLKDLFEHQVKDMYCAEKQLIAALPKMMANANLQKTAIRYHPRRKKVGIVDLSKTHCIVII